MHAGTRTNLRCKRTQLSVGTFSATTQLLRFEKTAHSVTRNGAAITILADSEVLLIVGHGTDAGFTDGYLFAHRSELRMNVRPILLLLSIRQYAGRAHSGKRLLAYRFVRLSVGMSVCLSVCPSHGRSADVASVVLVIC